MKISVIIPVFNANLHLKKCIDSILLQDCKDVELILVDDCSSDDSYNLCKSFKSNYTEIKVLQNSKNSLPGYTRNVGLAHATGDYIWFVDSDDWLEANSISQVRDYLINAGNLDILIIGFRAHYHEKTGVIERIPYLKSEKQNFFEEFLKIGSGFYAMPFIYIFSNDFLIQNNLFFPEKVFYEDILFIAKVLLEADKVTSLPVALYNYNKQNQVSITESGSEKKILDLLNAYDQLSDLMESKNILSLFQESLVFRFLVFGLYLCFRMYENLPINKRKNEYLKKELYSYLESPYLSDNYLASLIVHSESFDSVSAQMKNLYKKRLKRLRKIRDEYTTSQCNQ